MLTVRNLGSIIVERILDTSTHGSNAHRISLWLRPTFMETWPGELTDNPPLGTITFSPQGEIKVSPPRTQDYWDGFNQLNNNVLITQSALATFPTEFKLAMSELAKREGDLVWVQFGKPERPECNGAIWMWIEWRKRKRIKNKGGFTSSLVRRLGRWATPVNHLK